jgi:hypothetical protein
VINIPDREFDREMTSQIYKLPSAEPSVILLIPTVEGRVFLPETLASVREHAHCFDRLLLSVNGATPYKAEQILLEQGFNLNVDTTLFCTRRNLSARQHFRFINKKLPRHARNQDLIFLLADDDILPAHADILEYIQAVQDENNGSVGMGRFATFDESSLIPSAQSQHIEPGESISPLEFLQRNEKGHRMTNISSMLIPYSIFKQASSFMWILGSSGRRTEYIFATHRSVNLLYSPPGSSALIRQHPGQEGRTLSFQSYLLDELVYISWVWIHQPAMRPWAQTVVQEFKASRFRSLLQELIKRRLNINAHWLYLLANKVKSLYR